VTDELGTPRVTVDLDADERNIARMAALLRRMGLALRVHVKTHRSAQVMRLQLEAGALGTACQKLGEAETPAAPGTDVLVTFPLVGAGKARRLAELAATTTVSVAAREPCVRELSQALHARGAAAGVLVGLRHRLRTDRCAGTDRGGRPRQLVDRLPGPLFAGLVTHPAPSRATRSSPRRRGSFAAAGSTYARSASEGRREPSGRTRSVA
jgi:D-serine deaminase-like pyridoxal phosphate-dependent protein